MKSAKLLFLLIFLLVASCRQDSQRLFVGGFTKGNENGMTVFDFDTKSGNLSLVSINDVGANPSYFCFSKKNNLFYVANEVNEFQGIKAGGLTTCRYDEKTGSFEKISEMAVPFGGPCYISLSPDSTHLFFANYPTGSIAVVKLNSDGLPEKVTDTVRYEKTAGKVSHAHMMMNDPSGQKIYVSDLGLDRLISYAFDEGSGKLSPIDTLHVPEGFGPRHFTFNSDGSFLYVINELGSMLTVFSLKGSDPELIQTLPTTRPGFRGESYCADIHFGRDGRYLYGSNRGENSIVVFEVLTDGTLKSAGHSTCGGNWPRNFALDPSGEFLLAGNQRSDSIAVFRIDQKTGIPEEPGAKYRVAAPACLKFW